MSANGDDETSADEVEVMLKKVRDVDEDDSEEEQCEDTSLLAEEDRDGVMDEVDNKSVNLHQQAILRTKPPNFHPSLAVTKITSATALREARIRRQEIMIQKHTSQTGKVVCGVFVLLIVLGLGASLVVLARLMDVEDLYIVGGIFLCGGTVFFIGFVFVRCQGTPVKYKEFDSVEEDNV